MSEEKSEFQVGDIVYAKGFGKGFVEQEYGSSISVLFGEFKNHKIMFDKNGKYMSWHEEPILELVERPKKKKKVWLNIFKCDDGSFNAIPYNMKEVADYAHDVEWRVACVEIEVDDE